jgi:cytochrome c oxidase cbb3-type subunit 4
METYTAMRQFADSWGLLAMFLVFAGVVIWVFLPGRKRDAAEAAEIPFKDYSDPDWRDADHTKKDA